MLNHITIMGRITKDIELRRTPAGVAVASFTLAVDRDFKGNNGEKETDFIDCVAWKNTAEFVEKFFGKGRMAVVSGRLQIRTWKDKDGNNRRTAEVVADNVYFGDSKTNDSKTNDGNENANRFTCMSDNWHDPNRQQTIEALRGGSEFVPLTGDDAELPF